MAAPLLDKKIVKKRVKKFKRVQSDRFVSLKMSSSLPDKSLRFRQVKAKGTLLQMVGADWLRSDKPEDDLAGRYRSIVQRYAARGAPEFFFVFNIHIFRGTTRTAYVDEEDPVQEAETKAFGRACAHFGLGLHLFH